MLITILPGCGLIKADRPTVQQGNVLTAEDLAQVEEGLTRGRVRELLGNPVLRDAMHPDRWDYLYYRTEGGAEVSAPERLTLFFEGERLARVVNAYEPPDTQPLAAPEDEGPTPQPGQSAPSPTDGPPQPPTPGTPRPGTP
ncbi:MAG: outer membrane protein assembly factor BamE [Halofilum sp. (in: g-proteobacteria)]